MRDSFPFVCKACGAKRDVVLGCEPSQLELYGSFIRCPVCMKTDRGNTVLYWAFLAVKVISLSALMALVAALTTSFFYVFVPLGIVALWADHRRFLRRLDLALMGAHVTGGPKPERLPRW